MLKYTTEADCTSILDAREMMGKRITASFHKTLNTYRWVISVSDLIKVPAEDILINLKDQDVRDVRKIKIRKNNEYIATKNLILTFDRALLSDKIKVGYLSAQVRPYIPNPFYVVSDVTDSAMRPTRAEVLPVARGVAGLAIRQKIAKALITV